MRMMPARAVKKLDTFRLCQPEVSVSMLITNNFLDLMDLTPELLLLSP